MILKSLSVRDAILTPLKLKLSEVWKIQRNRVCPKVLDLFRSFVVMRHYMQKSILKPPNMSLRSS